jgi:dienelactone hydrolase
MIRHFTLVFALGFAASAGAVELRLPVGPEMCLVYFDFARGNRNLGTCGGEVVLWGNPKRGADGWLEFSSDRQYGELDGGGMRELSRRLAEVRAVTVGGWFWVRRNVEQSLVSRGGVQIGPLGERFFRSADTMVNFCLGTDRRGFLAGTINGNGSLPFVHITVNDVPSLTWQQLAVIKTESGHHRFFQNGTLVHSDQDSMHAPSRQPWRETAAGAAEALRLQIPGGGRLGEAWIVGRALDDDDIAADYRAKRDRYRPSPPGKPVALREMHAHPPADFRPFDKDRVRRAMLEVFGAFPTEKPSLEPLVLGEEDCGSYVRRKVSIQVQPGDRMPLFLLIPKHRPGRVPAIICFYGTTSGAGKNTTVGLSGRDRKDPSHPNLSFALDMVAAGFVAVAPDYLRDGERIHPGDAPYDTTRFYRQVPDWSIHGKDIWDTMRLCDYLESLDFVDGGRIGMVGHSYGGHSTIFTAALEPRIKVAVSNGPVSAFREHGMHWGVPAGARASQSLPKMRPYLLDPNRPLPVTFAEITALVAPRPLWIGQAVGENRPLEEQNHAEVARVFESAGARDRVRYVWYSGDHDFPPVARSAAVEWLKRWLATAAP